ncbi:hypothetical protein TNIN_492191 [Trichonephila inaurata madagascariensis]|uniref:Uncharacterized protein n=1 Tax=Trichonephila inaurata madagascariensis TaxID=2747483 RepID=A0A8X6IWD0_9ARAC|nr:hypothetical protein TNIN_492191 [Trichonephila inaurata madagascariensis]
MSLRDTEERYPQPIDRSGLTPAFHLRRSVGQRERKGIPRTPFSSLQKTAQAKHAGWLTNGTEKERKDVMTRKRVENREGSLGYPVLVKPELIKDSKPFGKRSLRHLGL